jgi:hypothetical protein
MAKERGWWTLETTVSVNRDDRQHIADLITQGYTEGEINKTEDDEEKEKDNG